MYLSNLRVTTQIKSVKTWKELVECVRRHVPSADERPMETNKRDGERMKTSKWIAQYNRAVSKPERPIHLMKRCYSDFRLFKRAGQPQKILAVPSTTHQQKVGEILATITKATTIPAAAAAATEAAAATARNPVIIGRSRLSEGLEPHQRRPRGSKQRGFWCRQAGQQQVNAPSRRLPFLESLWCGWLRCWMRMVPVRVTHTVRRPRAMRTRRPTPSTARLPKTRRPQTTDCQVNVLPRHSISFARSVSAVICWFLFCAGGSHVVRRTHTHTQHSTSWKRSDGISGMRRVGDSGVCRATTGREPTKTASELGARRRNSARPYGQGRRPARPRHSRRRSSAAGNGLASK